MSTLKTTNLQHASAASPAIVLASDSTATLNGLAYPTSGSLSNRNLIINGAMDIWQRGTSQTSSGDYGADRFWMANATSAARSTDAPAGFTYSTKLTYNASDMSMGQPIELPATGKQGQLVAGETFTLSYYAKVDSGTEGINTTIKFRDSKFSSTNEVSFTSSNANASWTTTWTRYTHQFTVPTVGATNVLAGLEIAGISKDAYITGVQLEAGSVATPFERRSYGQELSLCQRYYEFGHACFMVNATGGTAFGYQIPFVVQKRVSPTITYSAISYSNANSMNTSRLYSYSFQTYANCISTGWANFDADYAASAEL